MSDFPEKDNTEIQDEFENSTIFSNPTEHKKVTVKPKKLWKKILAAVLCVAVLISGTVAIIKLVPVLEGETSSAVFEEISLKNLENSTIKTVTVKNKIGVTEFYSKKIDVEDFDSSNWFVKSLNEDLVDSTKISTVVDALVHIKATRKITEKTAQECGLTAPEIEAKVVPEKEQAYTVLLGSASPDNSGYYCQIKGSDEIYIVSVDMHNILNFKLLDFADTSSLPAIENADGNSEYFSENGLTKFDKLIVKGKNFPEPVEIVSNNDESISQYLGYVIKSPSKRIAENTEKVLQLFQSGVEVAGAYSYDVKPETLEKFGLNTPDLELSMTVLKQTVTYKFTLQKDGGYAAIHNNSKLIQKVDASVIEEIAKYTTTDFYSTWICYTFIGDLSNFTVKDNGKAYSFGIVSHVDDEESNADDSEEQEDYTITHNGKKVVTEEFQNLYRYCISLKCLDFIVEDLEKEPEVVFEFTYNNGKKSLIEFTKVSATKYQYAEDGVPMGRVSVNDINKMIENVKKLSKGEAVGEIF